jgi:hypothetical protein
LSQIYKDRSTGPVPPTVPTSFVTDVNSPAVPAANILNEIGGDTTANNDNGIRTDGSSGSNTLTIQLTNRQTATVTTADATPTTLLTFVLPAVAGTYYVFGNVQAFTSTGPAGGAYSFSGGYLTDGATSTELGTEFHDTFQSAALLTSDIFLSASGNNVIVTVQGVAGLTINWNALLEFRQVN